MKLEDLKNIILEKIKELEVDITANEQDIAMHKKIYEILQDKEAFYKMSMTSAFNILKLYFDESEVKEKYVDLVAEVVENSGTIG